MARLGVPKAAYVLFGKNHRRVKADYRKVPGHVQNVLYYGLARGGVQKVDLRGVVPRHSGAVVSVVNVAGIPIRIINTLKNYRTVVFAVVVVFQEERNSAVLRKVFAVKGVLREGAVAPLHEKVGPLDDPAAVHRRVVWNHVACKPDSALPQAAAQVVKRVPAAKVSGDCVVHQ